MVMKMKKLLKEMIPIVLGILIALFINKWKEDWNNKKFIERAFASINQEIQENRDAIQEVLPKQQVLLNILEREGAIHGKSIAEIIDNNHGIQVPTLKNTAWKFYVNSRTELIDYQIISQLTAMEESKKLLDIKVNKLLDFLYRNMEKSDKQSLRIFKYLIHNIIDSENQLTWMYDHYLTGKELPD
ncbi:MAG: hypothetical protein D6732_18925 [Methanobacteriota archaeon]|nr:MAG: hypothetical protein D6732_18925 [Euryarchaeota archaeon]